MAKELPLPSAAQCSKYLPALYEEPGSSLTVSSARSCCGTSIQHPHFMVGYVRYILASRNHIASTYVKPESEGHALLSISFRAHIDLKHGWGCRRGGMMQWKTAEESGGATDI